MKLIIAVLALTAATLCRGELPQGKAGESIRYRHSGGALRASVVRSFSLLFGTGNWVSLRAVKQDGAEFQVWLLQAAVPERYIVKEGRARAKEYRQAMTGTAVRPSMVPMEQLLPQVVDGGTDVLYLGQRYVRDTVQAESWSLPTDVRVVGLRPDMLVGPASNARQKDERRRWDGSDYEMVRFTRADYGILAEAGVNCVRVDDEQAAWAEELGLFYWGAGKSLAFPEMLYRSQYLGPALYLDEPAVGTRDQVLRPRLAKDDAFRRSITPKDALAAFRHHFDEALTKGAPAALGKLLASRADVDVGNLKLTQENLYSWETMVSTAGYQLSRQPRVPEAIVFEPPGRIGTRRTLPEMNLTYGTQFPVDDPRALANLIFSFLRGAARLTAKSWGVSIYGAVDRADASWWLAHAYDMGATRFHFWDNYQLACVPFNEYVALARHLRNHAAAQPPRNLKRLREAAEVVITLPAGYDLGHTQMGRGNLWGLAELNLDRVNGAGVQYRTVMSQFFLEAERCLRLGVEFDAIWDLAGLAPQGYREVVRVREDGKVEVTADGRRRLLVQVRQAPSREGAAPDLSLKVEGQRVEKGVEVRALGRVTERAAPVYYTHGTDSEGVYRNAMVIWELFGPHEEDYRFLLPEGMRPKVQWLGNSAEVEMSFLVEQAGVYQLRAGTVDTAGRRRIVRQKLEVVAVDGGLKLMPVAR